MSELFYQWGARLAIPAIKAYVAAMTLGQGPTELERDKQAAGELDALWAEPEVLMRLRVKR